MTSDRSKQLQSSEEASREERIARFSKAVALRNLISQIIVAFVTVILVGIGLGFIVYLLISYWNYQLFHISKDEVDLFIMIGFGYIIFFILPTVIVIPFVMGFAILWRDPIRIVVFRRFNVDYENYQIKKVVSDSLARFGHVFTLADKYVHMPWYLRIPVFIGQLGFISFRSPKVYDSTGLEHLRRLLQRRQWLNINWLMTLSRFFAVESTDALWQATVSVLLNGADIVIVDISHPRDALAWEIEQTLKKGLGERLLFLADASAANEAWMWLARQDNIASSNKRTSLFTYTGGGLDNPKLLEAHLLQVLGSSANETPSASFKDVAAPFVSQVFVGAALAATIITMGAPYANAIPGLRLPDLTAQYSPVFTQVLHSYLYGGSEIALRRMANDFGERARNALLGYLQFPNVVIRERALHALGKIGDAHSIEFIVEACDNNTQEAEDTFYAARLYTKSALIPLVSRLGRPAAKPLLEALARSKTCPYDTELFTTLSKHNPVFDQGYLVSLLTAQGQAARFYAALQPEMEEDLRIVPVLLEMLHWKRPEKIITNIIGLKTEYRNISPLEYEAIWKLKQWLYKDLSGLNTQRLNPWLLGSDNAAEYAVRLAYRKGDDNYLATALRNARLGEGSGLLRCLLRLSENVGDSNRVAEILAAARLDWLQSLISENRDQTERLDGAYALAKRGDPTGLPIVLDLLAVTEPCFQLFYWDKCYPYQNYGVAILDQLATSMSESASLPQLPGVLSQLSPYALTHLAAVFRRANDEELLRSLVNAYASNPDANDARTTEIAQKLPPEMTSWIAQAASTEKDLSKRAILLRLELVMSHKISPLSGAARESGREGW